MLRNFLQNFVLMCVSKVVGLRFWFTFAGKERKHEKRVKIDCFKHNFALGMWESIKEDRQS